MSRRLMPASDVADREASTAQFAADVQYYLMLQPRQLPSRYLYDGLGSALFEAICRMPWYRITRAEERLLAENGADIFRRVAPLSTIVELGSGSGAKLRVLLDSRAAASDPVRVHLVDISSSALEASAQILESFQDVRVTTHAAPYERGLQDACRDLDGEGRVLVLFLGSNIGNFDPPGANAFLRGVRSQLRSGDALLIGADLLKPSRALELAYDDPLGVTAAFNRNLLVRINRELAGNFDLEGFAHQAVWNADQSRIEMHLVARRQQEIRIEAAHLSFTMDEGEGIWTESSYKYRQEDVISLLEAAGFQRTHQWLDRSDGFVLTLVQAV